MIMVEGFKKGVFGRSASGQAGEAGDEVGGEAAPMVLQGGAGVFGVEKEVWCGGVHVGDAAEQGAV